MLGVGDDLRVARAIREDFPERRYGDIADEENGAQNMNELLKS
jgi:hypothetical protein